MGKVKSGTGKVMFVEVPFTVATMKAELQYGSGVGRKNCEGHRKLRRPEVTANKGCEALFRN